MCVCVCVCVPLYECVPVYAILLIGLCRIVTNCLVYKVLIKKIVVIISIQLIFQKGMLSVSALKVGALGVMRSWRARSLCVCVYVCKCLCVCVCVCVCVLLHNYIYVYICKCMCISVFVCVCVCVNVCVRERACVYKWL